MATLRIVELGATVSLLDYSDEQLSVASKFHAKFPESATAVRVHVISLILNARRFRTIGGYRNVELAQRYEAEVFACLFGVTDEVRETYNGSSFDYRKAALVMKGYKNYSFTKSQSPAFKVDIHLNGELQGRFGSRQQAKNYIDSVINGTTMLTKDSRAS